MSDMSWSELFNLRNRPENQTPEIQAQLAPMEHRAYARETVADSPLMGAIQMGVATPAYTLAKLFGVQQARSPASLNELLQGYAGIGDGLKDWWNK